MGGSEEPIAAPPTRVLLVEDNPGDALVVREMFERDDHPFRMDRVSRLSEALESLSRQSFDVVLLDLGLPDSQGLDSFDAIAAAHSQVPVLVVTGDRNRELGFEAVRRGAHDFLVKGESDVPRAVRYAMERISLQRRLEETQRMATLGKLASAFAHDFNNILMGIQPFVEVLQRVSPDEPRASRAIEQIRASVRRGKAITSEVLRFTRPAPVKVQQFVPGEWLESLRKDLALLVPESITLEFRSADAPAAVATDPAQLAFAVEVLVRNAVDSSGEGGEIVVDLQREGDERWAIVVSDRGAGIAPEAFDRLYEPLFTTRQKGSGLGLAIARQIAESLGGGISGSNRDDGGASFRISLPLNSGETDRSR